MHCRYAVLTHELAGDLAQFDVARWIDVCATWADGGAGPYEAAWAELPLFFQWLRAQTYADPARDLAVHHERAWDGYLRGQLAAYVVPGPRYLNGHSGAKGEADGDGEDEALLGDVLPLATYLGLLWDWAHFWPLLGVPPAAARALEERDRDALHVTGLRQAFDAYRHMLAGFLGDERRAGGYVLGGAQYVRVARRVARYLCEAKTPGKLYAYPLPSEWTWFRAEHDDKIYREKRAKETFQAGLQYLPFLLDHAAPNAALVAYLGEVGRRKTGVLDAIRTKELPRLAWAEDKARAEEAVEAYLARCRNGNGVDGSGSGEAMSVDEPS
ncbi:hypothetical protein HYPSUDRAFT_207922 [Hypholoma sublateritium FD-334 SS-4]|uniref:Uncharacterized protein n=1 Tax=Hypholoma sublateritium (strain FD-334 SS-4) TaxID=945553 RepID=A0A0D2KL72_HYPSF|nr:hypothetical protein HYPSUDRAFT_207922 [Hypholoma sublateritium FD-334 SS-4]